MKPFITDALENGRHMLRMQFEGMERSELKDLFLRKCIVAYALPKGHTLETAWQFQICFDSGDVFEFSSACTEVQDWQEIGSLNINKINGIANENIFEKFNVESFCISNVEVLVYEDVNVFAECGIVLIGSPGSEVIVAASVSPGSVSVQAPFSTLPFQPEFSVNDYQRRAI